MALGVARLEAALVAAGRPPSDLVGLRVLTTDAGALHDVLDVLTEGLAAMGATPDLRTHQ